MQIHEYSKEKPNKKIFESAHLEGIRRVLQSKFMQMQVSQLRERSIISKGNKLVDFASCGYLGLDNDICEEDLALTKKFGLRNGWSRISGNTDLTRNLEVSLECNLGFRSVRLAQSISLINYGIFYSLAQMFPVALYDRDVHITLKNGLRAAYRDEKSLLAWNNNDLVHLERRLESLSPTIRKLIVVDGIYSMKGSFSPIKSIAKLAAQFNAVLVIDDAHGFGVLGENGFGVIDGLSPDELKRIIYLGSFSKATSNPVAFVGCSDEIGDLLDSTAPFLIYSGPPSNFHTAIALRQLEEFPKGVLTKKRELLLLASSDVHSFCASHNIAMFSSPESPIVVIKIFPEHFNEIVNRFYSYGIIGKGVVYPVVRKGDEAVRFTLTSSHTAEQIELLKSAIYELKTLFKVRD
ncbi:MAG: pyridoxal phosphate-dependent aminotransferase family protein [Bdellovibrionota bacterium]